MQASKQSMIDFRITNMGSLPSLVKSSSSSSSSMSSTKASKSVCLLSLKNTSSRSRKRLAVMDSSNSQFFSSARESSSESISSISSTSIWVRIACQRVRRIKSRYSFSYSVKSSVFSVNKKAKTAGWISLSSVTNDSLIVSSS